MDVRRSQQLDCGRAVMPHPGTSISQEQYDCLSREWSCFDVSTASAGSSPKTMYDYLYDI